MGRKKRFYAYAIHDGGSGVVESWDECKALVEGRRARYKGFTTRDEAEAWLASGAQYEAGGKRSVEGPGTRPAEDAVYFDSGTGRGKGTEISVTDRDGVPLVHLAVSGDRLTRWGTVRLSRGRTNNYGELLACLLAIRVARALGLKKVFGDSKLVLDYWSRNRLSKAMRSKDPDLVRLAALTASERRRFEEDGGVLGHIPGRLNPADLGFHKD